jgi:hypothetical protein
MPGLRSIPLSSVLAALTLLPVIAPLLVSAACIPRQCSDDSFCIRECECESSATGDVIACPVRFSCDIDAEVCEDDYTELSCEEICQTFAARDLCGSVRCSTEADCVRSVTCNQFDPNTGQLVGSFDCQRAFTCDAVALACEAGYSLVTDDQICQECAAAAN